MEQKDLIGTWSLKSFKIFWKDSEMVLFPYGENAVGYLIYTADGYASVHIMRARRPKCVFDDFRAMSIPEKIEMADNSGGYVGRYEIVGSTVIHYPEVSIFPNFIDVPQIRQFQFSGDQMTLSSEYSGREHGQPGHSELVWKKVVKH